MNSHGLLLLLRYTFEGEMKEEGAQTGVLQFMGPAWVAWIVAGLLLNSLVSCKHHLPKLITDIMEYGKLRNRNRRTKASFLSMLSVPKRQVLVLFSNHAHYS